MNRTFAHRVFVRLVAVVLATVGAGLTPIALSQMASAAPGDVGTRAFRYGPGLTGAFIDPDDSPTASKPQSKLWYAQQQWWGILLDDATNAFHIHSFSALSNSWTDTGTVVDLREKSRADALWDGTHLYTVSALPAGTGAGQAIQFKRFSYNSGTGKYTPDPTYNKTINGGGVEAAVIAKDSTDRIWVAYTVANNVRVVVSPDGGLNFNAPMAIPVPDSEGLDPDDIATVVAHSNKISVVWSKQAAPLASQIYVASHPDSSAPNAGWTSEALITGIGAADDHVSMSVDGDGSGRVFVVAKGGSDDSSPPAPTDPLIRLFVLDGDTWDTFTHSTVGDDLTRPVVVVDRDANKIRVFATSPVAGGVIYEKSTSWTSPGSFGAGKGTPVLQLASDTFINNVTTTKQNVTVGTGLLLLGSDQKTGHYVHNSDSVPVLPAVAGFNMTASSGASPLQVRFTNTSTNATSYTWNFGDGSPTVSTPSPQHTFTEPGDYTVTLAATNKSGSHVATKAVQVNHPQVTARFTETKVVGNGPLEVTFTDTSTGGPTSWAWDFGDGRKSTKQHPVHEYTAPGRYDVTLTVKNPDTQNSETKSDLVRVYSAAGPVARMTKPTTRFLTTSLVSAAWAGAAGWPPVASYRVTRMSASHNGGFGATAPWRTTSATSGGFQGKPGRTYCMQVRATDDLGNIGRYSSIRCTAVPLDDRNLARKGKWRQVSARGSYLGTALRTRSVGATVAKQVQAKRVFLMVTKMPGGGRVNVYRGNRLVKRISLGSATVQKMKLVKVADYRGVQSGRFRVVVTSKKKPVIIDGLAVSRK